jgi:hypothetical protein
MRMVETNRRTALLLTSALVGFAVLLPRVADATVLSIINEDGPGEGLNDPTPAAPAGGNTGTTLGQQRLIALQRAADIWAGLISSAVTIRIGATFDSLSCNASGAVLGFGGPTTVVRDFSGAPSPSTWYPGALASALSGEDLDEGTDDIAVTFNSAIGTTCPFPIVWYYGLDGNAPASQIDFVSVALHEICHGLGFLTFVDVTTGAKFMGLDDTFMQNLRRLGATPPDFPSMSNAQRVAASTDTGNLVWAGPNVEAASGVLTAGRVGNQVRMFAPNPVEPGSSVSHWDTVLTPDQVMEPNYTGVLHTPVLEPPLLQDIGWPLSTTPPSPPPPPPPPPPPASLQAGFVPVTPCRVLDTRNPVGAFGGPFIAAGSARSIPVPLSLCAIPAGATAYALNVTVVPRNDPLGYLTLWPSGQPRPLVSTLNSFDGSVLANAAIVPAGTDGAISVFATNDTDVVVDISGYFYPPIAGALQFYPLPPCRILDTRKPPGLFGGPAIPGNTFRSVPVSFSGCGAALNAGAYSFNVTVMPRGALHYLTAWPTGQTLPNASTVNSLDGVVLANAAIVPAGTGGSVSFYASDTTDLVVDINGYFAPPGFGGLNFHPVTPCRLVDTRNPSGPLGGPIVPGNTSRGFRLMAGSCGLPSTAQAYSLNVTAVPAGPLASLTTWPSGRLQPLLPTLYDPKGSPLGNAALVPAGTSGAISVFVTDDSHVVIDTNGYFAP